MFSDTFAGIAPGSVPGCIGFQTVGAAVGAVLVTILYADSDSAATAVTSDTSNPGSTTETLGTLDTTAGASS